MIGLDPASASLDVARQRPYAEHVLWVHGDTSGLPFLDVDLVTMTGNVAQVFLTDAQWTDVLSAGAHRDAPRRPAGVRDTGP